MCAVGCCFHKLLDALFLYFVFFLFPFDLFVCLLVQCAAHACTQWKWIMITWDVRMWVKSPTYKQQAKRMFARSMMPSSSSSSLSNSSNILLCLLIFLDLYQPLFLFCSVTEIRKKREKERKSQSCGSGISTGFHLKLIVINLSIFAITKLIFSDNFSERAHIFIHISVWNGGIN